MKNGQVRALPLFSHGPHSKQEDVSNMLHFLNIMGRGGTALGYQGFIALVFWLVCCPGPGSSWGNPAANARYTNSKTYKYVFIYMKQYWDTWKPSHCWNKDLNFKYLAIEISMRYKIIHENSFSSTAFTRSRTPKPSGYHRLSILEDYDGFPDHKMVPAGCLDFLHFLTQVRNIHITYRILFAILLFRYFCVGGVPVSDVQHDRQWWSAMYHDEYDN